MIKMQTGTALSLGGMAGAILLFASGVVVKLNTTLTLNTAAQNNLAEKFEDHIDNSRVADAQVKENAEALVALNTKFLMYHE